MLLYPERSDMWHVWIFDNDTLYIIENWFNYTKHRVPSMTSVFQGSWKISSRDRNALYDLLNEIFFVNTTFVCLSCLRSMTRVNIPLDPDGESTVLLIGNTVKVPCMCFVYNRHKIYQTFSPFVCFHEMFILLIWLGSFNCRSRYQEGTSRGSRMEHYNIGWFWRETAAV